MSDLRRSGPHPSSPFDAVPTSDVFDQDALRDGSPTTPPRRQFRAFSEGPPPAGSSGDDGAGFGAGLDSSAPAAHSAKPHSAQPGSTKPGSTGGSSTASGSSLGESETARPRRRSRSKPAGRDGSDDDAGSDANQDADSSSKPRRRRGSQSRAEADAPRDDDSRAASAGDAPGAAATTDDAGDGDGERAPRRRRRSRRKAGPTTDGDGRSEGDGQRGDGQRGDGQRGDGADEPQASDDAPRERERERESERESDGDEPKKRRRRGTRGGRKHKKKREARAGRGSGSDAVEIETLPGEDDDLQPLADLPPDAELVSGEKPARKKRSRRSKKKSKSAQPATAETRRDDGGSRSGSGAKKKRKRKKSSRSREADEDAFEDETDEPAAPPQIKDRKILVNAVDPEETRVIVVEDGVITDLQMTVKKHVSYVSDIYRGRVVNLEPAIGAAFVDFGQGRNGFLHASDVLPTYGDDDWQLENLLHTPIVEDAEAEADVDLDAHVDSDEDDDTSGSNGADASQAKAKQSEKRGRAVRRQRRPRLPIEKLLKKGQMVAVQITKDAIGDKGPTLTTYVSIPGRYLVLMPSLERTGVSRKIEDERERRRLKRILTSLEIPEGMGVIVRTAGVGKTKEDIQRDLDYLLLAWDDFSKRLKSGRNPAALYQESDVAIKTMRDLYTSETEKVVVDDDDVFDRVVAFTQRLMPEHVERIHKHDGARPLFHSHGVEQDFEKIFSRRVELPSGGSIVIDQTEALVAIDVNSGRTREHGADFEDIALKTNLEAAPEIARQIRLRDLGGIIVLDYIDMIRMNNRRKVEKVTREALEGDRARSKIGRISQFGLLELTRQRLGPGLSKLVYDTCPTCKGTGRRRSPASRAQAILRRLGTALLLKGFTSVEVRAHPDVIEHLEKNLQRDLDQLENDSGRKLVLVPVPDQVEDSVLHYLRADGREVRPGGRKKR